MMMSGKIGNSPKIRIGALFLAILLLPSLVLFQQAHAQTTSEPAAADTKPAVDPYGRSTPRGTVEGYLRAIRRDDFEKAARFLDMSNIVEDDRRAAGIERAKQLIQVLDRNGYVFEVNRLSTSPAGELNDELDANVEQVGVLDRSIRKVPLLLHKTKGKEGAEFWLFEPAVLNRVPFLLKVSQEGLLDRLLPESLKTSKIGTVSTGHWLAVVLAALVALVIGYLISWVLISLVRKLLEHKTDVPGRGVLSSITIPLSVVIGVSLYRVAVLNLGIQVVARDNINWIAFIASWFALAWLGMRIIDGIAEIVRYSMTRTNRLTSVAMVMLARRLAKGVIFAIAAITVLDILGVDVTTGLAALGIGGLALALGAQRTIENLVGSITVVADKPVRVGDFCKFGEFTGTVEDIGIRSTQIRTLDRTVVTVPNGAFASMQIENYTVRDRFKFQTTLTMRYETTPDQIRYLLLKIRELLKQDDRVVNKQARVRFIGLGSHSLDIEIFSYISAVDYSMFLEIQEQFLLAIMDVVADSGTDFAFPSQTLYLGKDTPPSPTKAKKIAQQLRAIEKQEDIALPKTVDKKAGAKRK